MAVGQLQESLPVPPSSRASLAPTMLPACARDWCSPPISVGAELARDGDGSVAGAVASAAVIAGKPCSHNASCMCERLVFAANLCGSRACSRWRWVSCRSGCQCRRHRGQALLPQCFLHVRETSVRRQSLWERACSRSGGSVAGEVASASVIAGKPCSHNASCMCERLVFTANLCGNEPAREAVGQLQERLPVPPSSRASLAPTMLPACARD
ncbi:hypothetical protein SAMN04490183_0164 [Pseudomonas corrugata]|nr:hypothetical protein SAMN04490183_0164 [Pseudomonas corrugata]